MSCTFHIVKYPFYLCSRKVRIRHQTRFITNHIGVSVIFKFITIIRRSSALPNYCPIYRNTRFLIPHYSSFSLVCDTDTCNIGSTYSKLCHSFHRHTQLCRPYRIRIVLHPTGLWIMLCQLLLCRLTYLTFSIEYDTSAACSACIKGHNILSHNLLPLLFSF